MSVIRRGLESRAAAGTFTQTHNPLNTMYAQYGLMSTAGERVDEITALGISTVFSCISLLADTVSSMPLRCDVLQRDGSRTPAPLPDVIADPDPVESSLVELVSQIVISAGLHGNSYNFVAMAGGKPAGIIPFHPYQMNVMSSKDGGGRTYLHLGKEIPREQMLHIRAFTPPQSLVGVSPLMQQRTTFGIAIAMDRYLAQWYAEGGTPSGVLETDRQVTTEGAKALRESWEATQRKHRRPAILSDGLKWRPVSVSAVDMDYVASAEAMRADIARAFRVPPHLINVTTASSDYANVEQSSINFLTYTLQPWLTRIEVALSKLLPPGVDVHFDPSSLLRLDAITAATVDKLRIATGTRTPNEARIRDGLQPYPEGDQFTQVFQGAAVDPGPVGTGSMGAPNV